MSPEQAQTEHLPLIEMKPYLLDTDICIAFLQGKYRLKEKIQHVAVQNCYVSEITIAELFYGAYFSE